MKAIMMLAVCHLKTPITRTTGNILSYDKVLARRIRPVHFFIDRPEYRNRPYTRSHGYVKRAAVINNGKPALRQQCRKLPDGGLRINRRWLLSHGRRDTGT